MDDESDTAKDDAQRGAGRWDDPEWVRQYRREYRQRHAAKIKAYQDAWRHANPERHDAHSRASAQRAKERRRRTEAARETRRRWEATHKGHAREYRARWRDANRDRVRAHDRASYQRRKEQVAEKGKASRDADPDKYAANLERSRQWRLAHAERVAQYSRDRRQDPEKYERQLQQNRDAKRLRRRLNALGLPPALHHRSTAAEKRAHERDALEFFTSPVVREWHRQYDTLRYRILMILEERYLALRSAAVRASERGQRVGLPAADIEAGIYARAVEEAFRSRGDFSMLKPIDIARVVEDVKGLHERNARDRARQTLLTRLDTYERRHAPQLLQEATLENRARMLAGKRPVPLDLGAHIVAFQAIKDDLPLSDLTPADINSAIARLRLRNLHLFDPAATPTVIPHAAGAHIDR